LEFIFNLSILRSLVPDFPEGLIATPLQPVTLICSRFNNGPTCTAS